MTGCSESTTALNRYRKRHGRNNFFCSFVSAGLVWLALLVVSQSIARALQVQSAPASQEPIGSPQSETEKKPERIFGVVPAYSITDAQNAPPLTSKQKFHLFVSGTLDPFPFAVYGIQAGVEQAEDAHSG
jgi:hypothetical protein